MKNLVLAALVLFTLSSCEKVIDVDLNDSDPKYVIEGLLELGTHDFKVSLTQTTSYFTPQVPTGIAVAQITLSDNMGNSQVLTDAGNGLYTLSSFSTQSGIQYTLNVSTNNQSFQASAEMPSLVEADTLLVEDEDVVKLTFKDPIEDVNYYRLLLFVNGERLGENLLDDELLNGDVIERNLTNRRGPNSIEEDILPGDTVISYLQSVDSETYTFLTTLEQVSGGDGPGGTAPGNPVNNWSNGALGYFGAMANDISTIVIP